MKLVAQVQSHPIIEKPSAKSTARAKRLFAERKAQGLCPTCGKERTDNRVQCVACRDKSNRSLVTGRKVLQQTRRKAGLCRICGRERIGTVGLCKHHWLQKTADNSMGSTTFAALLSEKLEAQGWRCYYTGVELVAGEASIDHLLPVSRHPELRSEPSNVVWCLKSINLMKNGMTEEEFVNWCKIIGNRFSS